MLSTHGAFSQVLNMEVELSWYEQPSRRSRLEKSTFSRPLRNANKHEGHFTGSLTGNAATSRQTKRRRPPNYFYANNWTSTCFLHPSRAPKMGKKKKVLSLSTHCSVSHQKTLVFYFPAVCVKCPPPFFSFGSELCVLLRVFSHLAVRAWSAWLVARNFSTGTIPLYPVNTQQRF